MNSSLLMKSFWAFYCGNSRPWVAMIRRLHYKRRHPGALSLALPKCSPLWKGVLSTSAPFNTLIAFELGDGRTVSFWHSRWVGHTLFRNHFPTLFATSSLKNLSVNNWVLRLGSLHNFRFPASIAVGGSELLDLREIISSINFEPSPDNIVWRWDKDGRFSVRSAYNFIVFDGVDDNTVRHLWRIKIPPKVKLFLWLATRNRIMTADNLTRRGWVGPSMCCLCGSASETLEHLFFTCSFASEVWSWNLWGEQRLLNALLGSGGGLAIRWLRARATVMGRRKQLLDLCVGATCWEIWIERNQRIFGDKSRGGHVCGTAVESSILCWIAVLGA